MNFDRAVLYVAAALGVALLLWAIRQCFRRSTRVAGILALAFGGFGAWILPEVNETHDPLWQLSGFAFPALFVFLLTVYRPPATQQPAPDAKTTSPARALLLAIAVIGFLGCIPGVIMACVAAAGVFKGDSDSFEMLVFGVGLVVPPALLSWFFWRLARRANTARG